MNFSNVAAKSSKTVGRLLTALFHYQYTAGPQQDGSSVCKRAPARTSEALLGPEDPGATVASRVCGQIRTFFLAVWLVVDAISYRR